LKTRKLLILRNAENALASGIVPNWNVSGTRCISGKLRVNSNTVSVPREFDAQ